MVYESGTAIDCMEFTADIELYTYYSCGDSEPLPSKYNILKADKPTRFRLGEQKDKWSRGKMKKVPPWEK